MIKQLLRNITYLLGFHTNRKVILFASDDWGGIRLKSKQIRQQLIRAGLDMGRNRFDLYDTLESNDDLERLYEILLGFRDFKGNNPVLTALVNVANPDFERIRSSYFSEYFYESFIKTLIRYPNHDRVYDLYKKGIELKIFVPEFHGREHLQVNWWLQNLQNGNEILRHAFDLNYWYVEGSYLVNQLQRSLGAAFNILNISEIEGQKMIIRDGALLFNNLFGYSSMYFTPPAQHYNYSLESAIGEAGIKMIDVPRFRKMPRGQGRSTFKLHYTGQTNDTGLKYVTRNTIFETNLSDGDDGIDTCLKGIETAFRFSNPAIISNHRASFTGGIDPKNRDRGLKSLKKLLKEIYKRWPDSEFITARGLFELMSESKLKDKLNADKIDERQ